jgi:hypothetical protein
VGTEFRKNAHVKDEQVVEQLRGNAVRALSNYLMLESMAKDDNLSKYAKNFSRSEAASMTDHDNDNDDNRAPVKKTE